MHASKETQNPEELHYFSEHFAIFRDHQILDFALGSAASGQYAALAIIFTRHGQETLPYRASLVANIPETEDPAKYKSLLPRFAKNAMHESLWEEVPWRRPDWVEADLFIKKIGAHPTLQKKTFSQESKLLQRLDYPAGSDELAAWYSQRALDIDKISGQTSVAASFLRHGIANGFGQLAPLLAEISIFRRLIFDVIPDSELGSNMNFRDFRELSTKDVVALLMQKSSEGTFVADIKGFVLPFLKNRHEGEERAQEIFTEFVADLAEENIVRCSLVFEHSRHSLPAEKRILSNDLVMMETAMRCLYRCPRTDQWNAMNKIFCSLPSKSASSPFKNTPEWKKLQTKIDLLDLQLNAAELFDKYKIPQPLSFFEKAADSEQAQRMAITKLSRRGVDFSTTDEWITLFTDLNSLQSRLFTKVSPEAVQEIFVSSLLSNAQFDLAKELLSPKRKKSLITLEGELLETTILGVAREFFNNAESGKHDNPDMESARHCLSLLHPPTAEAKKELALIYAVNDLARQGVYVKAGIPVLPMEVRVHPNRGELVLRMLEINSSLHKDIPFLMRLLTELDAHTPENEALVLSKAARAAVDHRDFEHAFEVCKGIASRRTQADLVWPIFMDLALSALWDNVSLRRKAAVYALQCCPGSQLPSILTIFQERDMCDLVSHVSTDTPASMFLLFLSFFPVADLWESFSTKTSFFFFLLLTQLLPRPEGFLPKESADLLPVLSRLGWETLCRSRFSTQPAEEAMKSATFPWEMCFSTIAPKATNPPSQIRMTASSSWPTRPSPRTWPSPFPT